MKVVAFLPIKLNSQRVPKKNIRKLGEHSLCYYVPNTLLDVKGIDEVYVYCSDEKVTDYIPKGVKFLKRESRLDGDLIKGFDIYEAFINEVDADIYVLAHTTSPFIRINTIQNALDKVLYDDYDSSFSARKFRTFAWYQGKPFNYDINNVPRTQEIDPLYIETSAFFIFKKEIFTKNRRRIGFKPYIQEVNEIEGIDIDEPEDFEFAENIMKNGGFENE